MERTRVLQMYENNPRYEKIDNGEWRDLETGDVILELDDDVANALQEVLGRGPNDEGNFELSEEEFIDMFLNPYRNIFSDESDLNDL